MHWTYAPFEKADDLEQGDILAPTGALRDVLRSVHRHFCDEKYLGFVLATQSCDLVRRRAEPKALYISIAVIRSLRAVLPKLLQTVARPVAPGVFRTSARAEARQLLERLFDQNEQGLGLFYLHADTDVGLGEHSVALLRVKVALRAQHYDVLTEARRGRLAPEFRAKFGWLLGNLYSRAAAPDWSDMGDKAQVDELIHRHLREPLAGAGPVWVDDELVEAGKIAGIAFSGRRPADLVAELEAHRPKPLVDQVADLAVAEASRVFYPSGYDLRLMRNRLVNSGALKKLLK